MAHLKAKQAGSVQERRKTVAPPHRVINLVEALRRSVAEDSKPAATRKELPQPQRANGREAWWPSTQWAGCSTFPPDIAGQLFGLRTALASPACNSWRRVPERGHDG